MTAPARHRQTLGVAGRSRTAAGHTPSWRRLQSVRTLAQRVSEGAGGQAKPGFSGWEGLAVPDNIELIMRFHPVGGEDVSVLSKDFGGEKEALERIAHLMDERRSLVLRRARYDREEAENGVVVNLANVVSVRVSMKDSATTGQYL